MKKYFLLFIIIAMFINANCTTPPPTRINKESSVIAINIWFPIHSALLTSDAFIPNKVYFIKIEDNDSLKAKSVITSNYWTESWNPGPARYTLYLMGAEPGKYAAVAASGCTLFSKGSVTVFFPKEVINASIVVVQPNSMIYMGHFYLTTGKLFNGMKDADEFQNYYSTLISKRYSKVFAPEEEKSYNSEELRKEFIKSKADEFKGTEWEEVVK